MEISAGSYNAARFSSRALPEQGRGKLIEELHERGLLGFKFTPHGKAAPHVEFVNRSMSGLRILTATYAGVRREALPGKLGQQGGDHLYLCLTLAGTSLVSRREREIVLSDGDAVLMTGDEPPWTLASPSPVSIAGVRLPRSALAPLISNLDDAVMRKIPRDAGGLRVLRKYLEVVADDETLAAPATQRVIINHFYDLAALAVGATYDRGALAKNVSVRAARLAAIKADIVANLDDGNLSAGVVAARNCMTVRYLHKLFEKEGATYSEFVLGRRLERVHAILRNPLHAHRGIGTIAFELGFNDLSYFNRAFRLRYDATPSDVRKGMRRD
jgi:AraC-like DNA-binding protein